MSAPQLPSQWLVGLFWLALLGSLTLLFNGFVQQRDRPNHGLTATGDTKEVVLLRNHSGHYLAPGKINGVEVEFLLDTGATQISIPDTIAKQIGLREGRGYPVSTANGVVTVYHTQLKQVQLGNISVYDVAAHINPHFDDDVVLLGMSFMKHLDMTQRNGTLTLRIPDAKQY